MTHEKVIKDARGTVKIRVRLHTDPYRGENGTHRYAVRVSLIAPRKRKEYGAPDAATAEEIHAAIMELWEKLKPIGIYFIDQYIF